jgi:hypothetical protein
MVWLGEDDFMGMTGTRVLYGWPGVKCCVVWYDWN